MSLRLEDRWLWDFWFAEDGDRTHIFYLQADRSLEHERQRHWNVSIGHAVSQDLTDWEVLDDVLSPGPAGSWDDMSTWTGSVIRRGELWYLYYTGASSHEKGLVQRIGLATSSDLATWTKHPDNPFVEADPRWYEELDLDAWHDQAWRDPWVFGSDEDLYHMLITGRAAAGDPKGRGVIGHATSRDLVSWKVQPPLTQPAGFGQMEVPQVLEVDGNWWLLFSCGVGELAPERRPGARDGTYLAIGSSPIGPFDIDGAKRISPPGLFSGKAVRKPSGELVLLGFRNYDELGEFVGELSDPIPLPATVAHG